MSSKLDTSLDEILKSSRKGKGRGGNRGGRRSDAARPAPSGPVGGVAKNTRNNTRQNTRPAAGGAAQGTSSKILVSNLPDDITEAMLQGYFKEASGIARPKKVMLQFGPTGKSLGTATIIFATQAQAIQATGALNGVKIDNRALRVEMLVSAANLPAAAEKPSLADRITSSTNKANKPKPATASKADNDRGRGAGRGRAEGRGGRGRGGRESRPKKKTTDELDAEMADYFPSTEGNYDAGAQAAPGGDVAMDDQML